MSLRLVVNKRVYELAVGGAGLGMWKNGGSTISPYWVQHDLDGTLTLDWHQYGDTVGIYLMADVVIDFTNIPSGSTATLYILQDNVGGHTIDFAAGVEPGLVPPTVYTSAMRPTFAAIENTGSGLEVSDPGPISVDTLELLANIGELLGDIEIYKIDPTFKLNAKQEAQECSIKFMVNSLRRWQIGKNSGGDYVLNRYATDGTFVSAALTADWDTGEVMFGKIIGDGGKKYINVASVDDFIKTGNSFTDALQFNLEVGTYSFLAMLDFTTDTVVGQKYKLDKDGTLVASFVRWRIRTVADGIAAPTIEGTVTDTAFGTSKGVTSGGTAGQTMIWGTIVVTTAGALKLQYANNGGGVGTSKLLKGSWWTIWKDS